MKLTRIGQEQVNILLTEGERLEALESVWSQCDLGTRSNTIIADLHLATQDSIQSSLRVLVEMDERGELLEEESKDNGSREAEG